jgi:hypothetical protein
VQRAWSNRQASLGRDPCVPSRARRPYVALVPRQPTVRLADEGDSATITLEAAADRSVTNWAVEALAITEQEREPCVEASLDRRKVIIGETANLTVTRRKLSSNRLCIVRVISTLGSESYVWPLAVVLH